MRGLLLGALLVAACHGPLDEDGDGFTTDDDCDDASADVNPGKDEACNGIDDDCDDLIDDADQEVAGTTLYYADADADGFGDVELGSYCTAPDLAVVQAGDCDDTNAAIGPEAAEICDGIDDDCDGLVDAEDDSASIDAMWYRDGDDDGYGSSADFVVGCEIPEGYVSQAGDCDDGDADRNPGAPEVCDGKDNNCDVAAGLLVDDADPAYVGATGDQYLDEDGDGVGGDTVVEGCDPDAIGTLVGVTGDCDDGDPSRFPGAVEACDAIDSDCDGTSGNDEWSLDTEVFRVAVDVTGAASGALVAPPFAVDVDLTEPLQGGEGVSPSTLLFVSADCAAGFPKIPFDFANQVEGFFDQGESGPDKLYYGAVGFRYDTDGVWSTLETLPASGTHRFYLYWSSDQRGSVPGPGPVAPAMTFGTTTPTVDNHVTTLTLDAAQGGLASFLGLTGGDNVGPQTSIGAGNGVYFGSWVSTLAAGSNVAVNLISNGDVMAVYRAKARGSVGTSANGFKPTYTFMTFNGRPEVFVKTTFELTGTTNHVGDQSAGWASAVRPFEADLVALGTGVGSADPGKTWMRSSFASDTKGVFVGWRTLPTTLASPVWISTGRYIGLAGADYDASAALTGVDVPTGTKIVDGRVVVVAPYAGSWASVSAQMLALREGGVAATGTAASR